jgi:DNA-binding MarR family transcriptional regulator
VTDPATSAEDTAEEEARLDGAMELIHFAFRRVVAGPDALLGAHGMGRLHHRVLYVLGKNPGIRVLELADLLGVSKQAIHGPLAELRGRELVDDAVDPDDGRARILRLTPQGERFERRLARLQHDAFREAFAQAGPEAEAAWRRVSDLLGGGRRLRRA